MAGPPVVEAQVHCEMCSWHARVSAAGMRLDQAVYQTIWEHVEAAHFKDVKDLRAMSIADRKALILSWSTRA